MSDSVDKRSIAQLRCGIASAGWASRRPGGSFRTSASTASFWPFLATGQLLPVGPVVARVLRLIPQNLEARPVVEVIRHTEEGLGARFVEMGDAERRRLRRLVTELNTISDRRRAAELAAVQGAAPPTIDDGDRIREILAAAGPQTAAESFIVVPQNSDVRIEAHLVAVAGGRLVLRVHRGAPSRVGHPLLVLLTSAFASYPLDSAVVAIDERQLAVRLPAQPTSASSSPACRRATPGRWRPSPTPTAATCTA